MNEAAPQLCVKLSAYLFTLYWLPPSESFQYLQVTLDKRRPQKRILFNSLDPHPDSLH
jgi:hypothetical protein